MTAMSTAQNIAARIQNHEAECAVTLESHEGVGLVCPACAQVVIDGMINVELPVSPHDTHDIDGNPYESGGPDEAQATPQPGQEVSRRPGGEAADPITSNLSPIDGGHILTPDEVTGRIADTIARLERGANFHRRCIEEKAEADLALQMAWARAMNQADGSSADVRKAQATLACEQEITDQNTAELKEKAVRATMHDLRAMLSGYQSVARSVGATYQAAGQAYGDRPF